MSAQTLSPPRRRWPNAAPDGLLASVLLAFLATAGLFYVNIMPALVAGLQDGLGFSARDAALVGSANVYGAAGGALSVVFLIRRIAWRPAAYAALVGLIVLDLLSMSVRAAVPLMALRFCDGLVGGFLVGLGFAVIARTRTPDRAFGMLLVVQYGLGGVALLVLPRLVGMFGAPVLFLSLIAFSVVTLAMLPFLDRYPPREAAPAQRTGAARWPFLTAALAAVFLFQGANMALSAFIIGLGRGAGLATVSISETLAVANWIGALGSVAVVALGLRYGRLKPVLLGTVVTLVGTAAFLRSDLAWVFVAANIATAVVWAFVIPYLLGLCAAFDPGGRTAALGGFCSKMGLASGPALGGVLLAETHYARLIALALVGLALAGACAAWPALALDRPDSGGDRA